MKSKVWLVALLMGVFLTPALFAQDDEDKKDEPKEPTFTELVRQFKSEHRRALAVLKKRFSDAEDEEAREKITTERRELECKFAERAIEMTGKSDDDEDSLKFLSWVTRYSKGKAQSDIGEAIMKDFGESEELASFVTELGKSRAPSEVNEKWLRAILKDSPHENVRGTAAWTLTQYVMKMETVANNPSRIKMMAKSMGTDGAAEYLKSWTKEKCSEEMDTLLNLCAEDYADVKVGRSTVGRSAARLLAQANLKVGKTAPDITGEDLDGVEFKLSDYRGKVVVIDFWGDW